MAEVATMNPTSLPLSSVNDLDLNPDSVSVDAFLSLVPASLLYYKAYKDLTQKVAGSILANGTDLISVSESNRILSELFGDCMQDWSQSQIPKEPAKVSLDTAYKRLTEHETEVSLKGPGGRKVQHFTNTFAANPQNEDRVAACEIGSHTFVGSYDGHSGAGTSSWLKDNLINRLSEGISSIPASKSKPERVKQFLTAWYVHCPTL